MAAAAKEKSTTKKVITVQSKDDFDRIVAEAGNKHVLVEFFATWCGPCALIGPRLEEFAQEYADCLVIIKVDVDDNEDLAEEYDVSSMPSFLIIKNKIKLEQFVGSSGERVQSTLQKFCGKRDEKTATAAGAGAGPSQKPNRMVSMIKVVSPSKANVMHSDKK
ncbi:PREDICTED: thioredoxin-2 [Drosophila arizonae]|uniref:Thioredoxin-2 n=1 Tax=Drosophila arizonae TaxID=7263 RepID=A0ABM1P5T0_DROAR|nr:PREDICTED: thioredoxin-2 [Drosophila arizonae]